MEIDANKVATDVTVKLIESSIKGAWGKAEKYFKDSSAKAEIDYGIAYEEYLNRTYERYSKIKTIIYRQVPKNLYSFYECVGLDFNKNCLDTSSIKNLINTSSRTVISGTGGSGKSMLMKHLFLNAIVETDFVPVLIELRSFNTFENNEINLFDYIYESLVDNGFTLNKEHFNYSMKQGAYVVLLDGYDEIDKSKLDKVTREIKKISSKYNLNKFYMTSRPTNDFIGWNEFEEMQVLALRKEQALSLIEKMEFDVNVKYIFYKKLNEDLFDKYKSFASNPLLLNIMLLTFNNNAAIPNNLNGFYDQAFATLFNMHDATKESYVRDIRTKLSLEDFRMIFSYICLRSYLKSKYEFTEPELREYIEKAIRKIKTSKYSIDDYIDDLTLSVCMLVREGLNYRFTHRTFQEYFAAWHMCKLTDKKQSKYVIEWMNKRISIRSELFLEMLFNMQSDKVNEIIFLPELSELKKQYDKMGATISCLEFIYKGICVEIDVNDEETDDLKFIECIAIKDIYMHDLLMSFIKLNNLNVENPIDLNQEELELLWESYKDDCISFEDAILLIGEERILKSLDYYVKGIVISMEMLDKIEENIKKSDSDDDDFLD